MRVLLERSKTARVAVALAAAVCVLGFVHAAEAGGDLGLRRGTDLPDAILAAFGRSSGRVARAAGRKPVLGKADVPARSRPRPRRIWAAARGRPLAIARERVRKSASRPMPTGRAVPRPVPRPTMASAFRLVPPPSRTALVSIYADRTLRSGDAVMLDDGVHIFRDDGFWPHRPRDFVRLRAVAGLDWRLRQTLAPFDDNPPTRWTSIMVPPA